MEKIRPLITKETTRLRKPIAAEQKLAITIRYLATGESFESLMYQYRVHESTISKFIPEVCRAIFETLKDHYMHFPTSKEQWLDIAKQTQDRWQFPNCFGAADGKHIMIIHPKNSGSEFYNYKGFFSIVLLALVDYNYQFIFVDVGCQGRISDGGVYRHSHFYKALEKNELGLPDDSPLPQSTDPAFIDQVYEPMPYVFLGDEAFPLGKHCMKPYSQINLTPRKRVYNYRLSRMRRVTENAFGILANRFRIFCTKINLHPDKATIITMSALVLHNMLRELSKDSYTPEGFIDQIDESTGEIVDGSWREQDLTNYAFQELQPCRGNNRANQSASYIREVFTDHFWGPGQIPWQWKMI